MERQDVQEENIRMKCLKTNKICPSNNKKCKQCKWDTCYEVLNMIETQEEMEDRYKKEDIIKQLKGQCKHCSFLEIIDLDNQIVRCPYLIKERCILNDYKI